MIEILYFRLRRIVSEVGSKFKFGKGDWLGQGAFIGQRLVGSDGPEGRVQL